MIKKIKIENFKSIIETTININDNIFVLAGQNEAGKSSILEAMKAFEDIIEDKESLNFEEDLKGNNIQKISITYNVYDDDFYDILIDESKDYINEEYKEEYLKNDIQLIDLEKLKKIKEYTLTRYFDYSNEEPKNYLLLDKNTERIFKASINNYTKTLQDVNHTTTNIKINYLKFNSELSDISDMFWRSSPIITLFNNFADLLPDYISISDLEKGNKETKGINAVKNFQSLINQDLIQLSKKTFAQKKSFIESESKSITATFQNDWKQKINDESEIKISFGIENNEIGEKSIQFYLESKEGVILEPRKRSKGMIWFLSLWLELKNKENDRPTVLLFDEPGLYLHVKANNDMLSVFKKLKNKNHQIIYSTHSPSLIETDKLHNIGLVLNTKEKGTIVEGLTTSKLDTANKRDALQPVAEAMGLLPLKDFSILTKKNVLLEGLSDFWYFQAMSIILEKKIDYKFVPCIGIKSSKVYPLISFCIGYGLDWLLIMENGEVPNKTKEDIGEILFDNNANLIDKKIKILNFKEVEDMFIPNDFECNSEKLNLKSNKSTSELIGSKRKIIFAQSFYQAVSDKKITKTNIDKNTIKNFEDVFNFIDNSFNIE